jgi:hypothetical protein
MAAQFSDVSIPAAHNAKLKINLENGWYKLTVRQLFDPNNYTEHSDIGSDNNISFEVIITPPSQLIQQPVNGVYWYE